APHLDRQRVVVAVDMGHENIVNLVDSATDRRQGRLQLLKGARNVPAAVYQGETVGGVERVDVDRAEAVAGHGQRDAVYAVGDGVTAGGVPPRCGHVLSEMSTMVASSPIKMMRRPRMLPTCATAAFHSSLARALSRASRDSKLRIETPSQP